VSSEETNIIFSSGCTCRLHQFIYITCQEGRGKGRITGVVLDEDKKPIEGVEVHLQSTNFNLSMTTKSNDKGEWGFLGFGRDVFTLTFKKEGYLPTSTRLPDNHFNNNFPGKIQFIESPHQLIGFFLNVICNFLFFMVLNN
jgi:hypothetical protein